MIEDKTTVCLINDINEVAGDFSRTLGAEYSVRTFHSPSEALQEIQRGWIPDIWISAANTSDIDGVPLTSILHQKGIHSRVIFLEQPFNLKQFHEMLQPSRLSLQKNIGELFEQLSTTYYDRLALIEDVCFKYGFVPYQKLADRERYLQSLRSERLLIEKIARLRKMLEN